MCLHTQDKSSNLSSDSDRPTLRERERERERVCVYERARVREGGGGGREGGREGERPTLVHVVVFPLPCSPTNMITFDFPLTGCHTGTPGSSNLHNSLNTDVCIILLLLRPAPISSKSIADLKQQKTNNFF